MKSAGVYIISAQARAPTACRLLSLAGTSGDLSATMDACSSILELSSQCQPEELSRVAPVLARLLDSAAVPTSGAPACGSDGVGSSSNAAAAAVEAVCRTLIAVGHACTDAAPVAAAAVARAMVSHAASSAAMEQVCWLAGDLACNPQGMAAFLAEGGAKSIIHILGAQLDILYGRGDGGSRAGTSSSDVKAVAAGAVAQALVAVCSVASDGGGAVSLVVAGMMKMTVSVRIRLYVSRCCSPPSTAGAIPAIVEALGHLSQDDVVVAEAGCRALDLLLRQPSVVAKAAARRSLLSCGGVAALTLQLLSKWVGCCCSSLHRVLRV